MIDEYHMQMKRGLFNDPCNLVMLPAKLVFLLFALQLTACTYFNKHDDMQAVDQDQDTEALQHTGKKDNSNADDDHRFVLLMDIYAENPMERDLAQAELLINELRRDYPEDYKNQQALALFQIWNKEVNGGRTEIKSLKREVKYLKKELALKEQALEMIKRSLLIP